MRRWGVLVLLVAPLIMGATSQCHGTTQGARHSDKVIAQAARHAGFTGSKLTKAVAIALAESDGIDENSRNPDGSIDRGVWQINSRYHHEVTNACAHDLNCAARATWRISSHGNDFSPWVTYGGSRYRGFLPRARAAARAVS